MAAEPRVGDMTVDELRTLLRELLQEAVQSTPALSPDPERTGLEDFPVDDLGAWPDDLTLRREAIYGDDGR
ncbi:MAG: hypothetical protein SF029_13375 [bacterium]|nr:hypothetical protein [bacterium]